MILFIFPPFPAASQPSYAMTTGIFRLYSLLCSSLSLDCRFLSSFCILPQIVPYQVISQKALESSQAGTHSVTAAQQDYCFKCCLYSTNQRLQHLKLSPFSILCINYIPRICRRICIIQISVKHMHTLVIMLILPVFISTDTPSGILILL